MKPFEFDPQKSARNKEKHGIDFEEAQALWNFRVVEVRANVTDGEMRYANIGKIGHSHWTAIISYRGAARCIVSVYPSNPRQREYYERIQRPPTV